jgi:predicted transcriptional regulator
MLQEDVLKYATKPVREFVDTNDATVKGTSSLIEATVISSKDCHGRIIVVDDTNKPIGVLSRTEIKKVFGAFLGVRNELDAACGNDACNA